MRTTLTIDDDVAYGLKKRQKAEPDKSFKQIVNELLRSSLESNKSKPIKPFKVRPFRMGLREGLSLDNIEELLDQVEGPLRK
jgi:hypothetical protein